MDTERTWRSPSAQRVEIAELLRVANFGSPETLEWIAARNDTDVERRLYPQSPKSLVVKMGGTRWT